MERASAGMLMEWSPKTPSLWDWESPAFFGGNPKQEPQPEWGTDTGSVYSGSELGNASSSKSPVSISIDSSPHAGTRTSGLHFEAAAQGPTTATLAVGPQEPPIGLKLGKRTYFEDVCPGSGVKNPSSSSASSSSSSAAALTKPSRASHQAVQTFHCQIEGCNIDLTGAKDYHRKHRVCGSHSKCPRVIVAGQERRFCQQCSRFHELSAFDDQKRSCRKRLSDHNARRRKPQPGTITFNSARFSSPLHDDRQQMNLLLNRAPFGHIRPPASSTWQGSCDFQLAHVKGSWMKSTKGSNEGQLPLPSTDLSNAFSTLPHGLDRLLPFKSTAAEVLNQVPEASIAASNLDGAPDLRRALSLLSANPWGSTEFGPTTSLAQAVHTNQSSLAQPMIHAVNSASHYWQDEPPQTFQARAVPFAMHSNGSQFQEFQLLKAPYETSLIDSSQIH